MSRRSDSARQWGAYLVRRHYLREGWSDPGEQAAVNFLFPALRGARVLDLGVGGGRTTTILAPVASAYTGIDISPEMIRMATKRHPKANLRVADARSLPTVPDESCDVVVFSFNGIDAVDHAERSLVLREINRVLGIRGHLLISTLNIDGVSYGETPAASHAGAARASGGTRRLAGAGLRLARRALSSWYFRRSVKLAERGADWARWPLAAHHFRFVVHFTRLGAGVRSLREAGFDVQAGWADDGRPLDLDAESCDADYMHLVSVKRASLDG